VTRRDFAARVIRWQKTDGRSGLPWQACRDPYRVWLSEIMLQQTQVATVIPYYQRFLERFPDVTSLARAPLDEVMRLWSGLGYYSRARNLHAAARTVEAAGSRFPRSRAALEALPGIGRSTAAAIAALAFGAREAILDGNVKRVLARHFAVPGYPGDPKIERHLWTLAESLLPQRDNARYTQALMDLGATVCRQRRPDCGRCPLARSCAARLAGAVERFPAPRPRKALPVKRTAMLVLVHGGRVLLERRPDSGIWGGLWSLPQMPPGADPAAHCATRFGASLSSVETMPPLTHGFTHYTLRIRPMLCAVGKLEPRAQEPGQTWLAPEEAARGAVPAPVRRLLLGPAADRGFSPSSVA
jgi:A/G-specific adenine glycosylase